MFTVAARAPGAAGVNVNVKVQLADAATCPPASGQGVVPEPATAKSPGFAPARVMLVRLSVAVPPLVRVTVWARLLVVPTRWLPKATLFADNVTAGAMPVPVRVIVCGLPEASSTMFSVALRIPVASGVKLTLIVQLAPGATEPAPLGQVLPAAKAKSAACAPVMVMLVRFSGALPLLVRVTVCAALVVPTRCLPKALLVAESVAVGGVTPVPVSDTDCGLPGASSVMVTVAVRALAAVGVNVRLRRQLAPATTVAPFVQVVPAAMAKSPGFEPARAMLVMLRVAVPLLVRVTVCTGLVVLRRWSPKARLVGAKVTAGAMPIPASDTDCGLPGASSVMVTVAVRAPVAAGVKLMLIVQLAPGATEPAPVGQVLPAAKAKSAACAPVMVMLMRFSGVPPLLVSVRFCAALVVPTR